MSSGDSLQESRFTCLDGIFGLLFESLKFQENLIRVSRISSQISKSYDDLIRQNIFMITGISWNLSRIIPKICNLENIVSKETYFGVLLHIPHTLDYRINGGISNEQGSQKMKPQNQQIIKYGFIQRSYNVLHRFLDNS